MPDIQPLFSSAGLAALHAALHARPLLAFDFDGTLAPLVPRPEDARVPPVLSRRLRRLSRRLPVAIVTGRSVHDVLPRLGFEASYVVGNHGAEEPGVTPPTDSAPMDQLRERLARVQADFARAGIRIEDKGYSLALHYRQAADTTLAIATLEPFLRDLPAALAVVSGRMVRNIVLADAPDKGHAVASLVDRAHCDRALFVGDDLNDESVFVRAPANWLTVRVGNDYPQTAARYFLESYADVGRLLGTVLEWLDAQAG